MLFALLFFSGVSTHKLLLDSVPSVTLFQDVVSLVAGLLFLFFFFSVNEK